MDPEVVREMATNDRLSQSMPAIMAETDTSIAEFFDERKDIHGRLYDAVRQTQAAFEQSTPDRARARSAPGSGAERQNA